MNKIYIGVLGLGNVATGTIEILRENCNYISKKTGAEIIVKKVLVSDINKKRDIDLDKSLLTTDANDILLDDEISIVLELIGGNQPAFDYIKTAMENKKHVVSANKYCIAENMEELFNIAQENKVIFKFEAAVAGGIPIINGINTSLTANKINSIMGIINGTTNFILSKMTNENKDFDEVLKEAQELGYAEADPTSDVENHDAGYKLKILSKLAFGYLPDKIYTEGITSIEKDDIAHAKQFGYVIKSLAVAKVVEDKIELKVTPCMLKKGHPLASVSDSFNALFVNGNAVGDLMFYGRGAGSLPTGSAVVADLISVISYMKEDYEDIHDEISTIVDRKLIQTDKNEFISNFYVRLSVLDKPGVLAFVAGSLSKIGISIDSIIQNEESETSRSLVIFTNKVKQGQIEEFISDLKTSEKVLDIKNVFSVI